MEKKRILVVDDDSVCRKEVISFAERIGLEYDSVDSGMKGIDFISEHNYNILFIDYHMPDLNGFQTVSKMAEVAKGGLGHLILMSGDTILKEAYTKHGFDHFVMKPITKKDFDFILLRFGN